MRIIQITDLHIGLAGEDTFGVDVRANFLKILEEAKKLNPAQLIISGDFCYRDPKEEIYEWIRPHLDRSGMNYTFISGNHDEPLMLAKAFGREQQLVGEEYYYLDQWEEWPVLFLDTTTGYLSEQQLQWLKKQFEELSGPIIVFMHHPPMASGVPYMDAKHGLKNREEVMFLFNQYSGDINVFCGHYHVEKVLKSRNILLHITPSCFFQLNQYQQEFELDHHRIGMRVITLESDRLMSTVHYFEGETL